ncbi:MAG: hypothetical protein GY801_11660 [bacterium]|nr:hypothetical protein [bacterium]
MAAKTENSDEGYAPIIVDLGKQKRKQVKKLRKGKPGKLMDDVHDCLEELKANDVIGESAQPVIIVVREKPKQPQWGW